MTITTYEESRAWRPDIEGWADDILIRYEQFAAWLPKTSTVVELGVAKGRSLFFMAEALLKHGKGGALWGVDRFTEHKSEFEANLRKIESAAQSLISIVESDTAEAASLFDDASVDLVFIDADHSYEGVMRDIAAWRSKVKKGGLLAGHDYSTIDFPGVVRAVNESFENFEVLNTVWSVRV